MDIYSLAFSVSNIGPKSFQKLINYFGDSKKAWEGTRAEYESLGIVKLTYEKFDNFRKSFDIKKYVKKMDSGKVHFISFLDKNYPKSLKKIENPPIGIFCKGNKNLLSEKFEIGVVGTRKVTEYGRDATQLLVSDLVKNGAVIVSGLALGVDGIAHRVAIANKGLAIAVMGCGVDCCNPAENFGLYSQILANDGLIISEYPLSMTPNKGTFLARNRIIAALSDGVLITEAATGSGSLITAEYALLYGKKVFAVPGQITSKMSDGTTELLKKGAKLVSNVEDILKEFSVSNSKVSNKYKIQKLKLSKEEKRIVSILQNEALTIDEILKKTKMPIAQLFSIISNLELKGIVKNSNGKLSYINS